MTTCTDVRDDRSGVVQGVSRRHPVIEVQGRADPITGDEVRAGTRYLLIAFTGLTALATHQLLVLGRHTERFWPWTIHSRATAGFLAAAYAAGFVLSALALRQRSWRQIRVAVATVAVFTLVTLVPTILHAHRLHLADPDPVARAAAWFWVVVYVLVPLMAQLVLGRQQAGEPASVVVRMPVPSWLRKLLGVQGTVLLAAGLALFVGGCASHHGMDIGKGIWPWSLTPLGAQVIGAWLIAFGVGTGLVLREGDLARLRVPAVAYTAFGVFQGMAFVLTRSDMDGPDASLWVYGTVLAVVVLTGGYGWWAIRRSTRRPRC